MDSNGTMIYHFTAILDCYPSLDKVRLKSIKDIKGKEIRKSVIFMARDIRDRGGEPGDRVTFKAKRPNGDFPFDFKVVS
jgi:hypothetical protein